MRLPARTARSSATAVGMLLALGAALGWLLLHRWQPLPFPGPEEEAALETPELRAAIEGSGALQERQSTQPARALLPERGAVVLVLDAVTHRPLERVEFLLRGRPARLLGRTGPDGRLGLPGGVDPGGLLVRRAGQLGLFLGLDTTLCGRLRAEAASGQARIALVPDPVTRPLWGRVSGPGEAPGAATVALFCLEPADPERPSGLPPALGPAYRVSLAVERMSRGAPREAPWELGRWDARTLVAADPRGRFGFRTLSHGPALLRATTPSGLVARLSIQLPATAEIELPLAPGSWLRPLAAGAGRIRALSPDGWPEEAAPGDLMGPFLPRTEIRLTALWPDGEQSAVVAHAPPAGQAAEVALPVPGGGRAWFGQAVALGSGAPLAGVTVQVLGGARARTCEEGRFQLELGGNSGPVAVLFENSAIEARRLELERSGPLPDRVELLPSGLKAQVAAGLLVHAAGRVLGSHGAVAGALIEARTLEQPGAPGLRARGITEERTDSEGDFKLLLPAPGRYLLDALHLESGRGSLSVEAIPGFALSGLVVVLEAPLRLAGQVRQADTGAPLAGILVTCSRPGQPTLQTRTDPDGRFAFPLPGPGLWRLEAQTEGGTPVRKEVDCAPGHSPQVDLEI